MLYKLVHVKLSFHKKPSFPRGTKLPGFIRPVFQFKLKVASPQFPVFHKTENTLKKILISFNFFLFKIKIF
ncbi:hypothetical protein NC652_002137 [Populus alba x Populus x berolinensis]|nr:hypothetical protein NC652_002137 [Populus alba x Populus x berolinensis]